MSGLSDLLSGPAVELNTKTRELLQGNIVCKFLNCSPGQIVCEIFLRVCFVFARSFTSVLELAVTLIV